MTNVGHGHVFPRVDGVLTRCGGPGICKECSLDLARKIRDEESKIYKEFDSVYRHKITGILYGVVSRKVTLKNPATREWEEAVLYVTSKEPGQYFVRGAKDFEEKFERIALSK